jgi:hypothetical protein
MDTNNKHETNPKQWHSIDYVLFIFCAVSLLTGAWGWIKYYEILNDAVGFDTALLKSMQLFLLNAEFGTHPIPLALNIARFASPLLLATAIIKQLVFATSKRMDAIIVNLTFKNHYVICGLGAVGYKIASDCLKNGNKLVVIEKDADKVYMNDIIRRGAVVIIGDATDPHTLKKAGAGKASVLFATTALDTVNIQISFLVKGIIKSKPAKRSSALKCFIHIAESSTNSLLYNSEYCQTNDSEFDLMPFNINNFAANIVLDTYAPEKYADSVMISAQPLHVFIIGLGNIGESLLLNFARNCHYPCNVPGNNDENDIFRKNTVHLVDTNVQERLDEVRSLYPKLDHIVDVRVINTPTKSFGRNDFNDLLTKNPIKTVYVCLEDDVERFAITQNLKEFLNKHEVDVVNMIPVISNIESLAKEDCTLLGSCDKKSNTIQRFNIIEETCKIDILLRERIDNTAKVLNAMDLKSSQLVDIATVDKKWESAAEVFRQSSRYSAEHLKVKLRVMGLDWNTVTPDDVKKKLDSDATLSETLEHIEHIRFVAERFLDGWEPASEVQKEEIRSLRKAAENGNEDAKNKAKERIEALKKKKINLTLIPFLQLTEDDKSYNKLYISRMHELVEFIKS